MEGVSRFKSWLLNAPGLIHGGAYYRNFTVFQLRHLDKRLEIFRKFLDILGRFSIISQRVIRPNLGIYLSKPRSEFPSWKPILPFINSFTTFVLIHSFVHSFIHSLTHSFILSLVHLFTNSITHSFIHLFIHSSTRSGKLYNFIMFYCLFVYI